MINFDKCVAIGLKDMIASTNRCMHVVECNMISIFQNFEIQFRGH